MAEETSANEFVAYRNINTREIHLFEAENPDLEARSNFERVELEKVPAGLLDEARRARANAASIAAAGTVRTRRAEVSADEASRAAQQALTPPAAGDVPAGPIGVMAETPPTRRTGAGSPDGVLSRPGVDDVQIGPDPELHPRTQAELRAQAALDAEVPGNKGVLLRQHQLADAGDPGEVLDVKREHAADVAGQVPDQARQVAARVAQGTDSGELVVKESDGASTGRKSSTGRKTPAGKTPAGKTSTSGSGPDTESDAKP